jgi:hypothetical protein
MMDLPEKEEDEVALLEQTADTSTDQSTKTKSRSNPPHSHSFVVFFSAFIASVQYCVVLPTCRTYAEELKGGPLLSGLIVGGADIFSIPVTFVLPSLTAKSYELVFLVQCVLGVFGNLLYAFAGAAGSKVMLISGRVLAGVVAAYSFTCPNYLAFFVSEGDRTFYMQLLYSSVYSGVALGPVIGSFLASLRDFKVGRVEINSNNMPGFFMMACYLAFGFIIILSPPFPKAPKQNDAILTSMWKKALHFGSLRGRFKYKFALLTCILGTSLTAFLDGAWETSTVMISTETFEWSVAKTGYCISGVLGTILLANLAAAHLSYHFEDRAMAMVCLVGLCGSIMPLFDFGGSLALQVYLYFGFSLFYMPAVSVISSCFSSILSKIGSESDMMSLQTAQGVSLQLGLFLAALFGTYGLATIGRNQFESVMLLLSLMLLACTFFSFGELAKVNEQHKRKGHVLAKGVEIT